MAERGLLRYAARSALFVLPLAIASGAGAADHSNLEAGYPLAVEDAYPVGRNELEAQVYTRYRELRDDPEGDALVEVVSRLEWGALANGQVALELPYNLGSGEESDRGAVGLELLYNLNTETLRLPALSIAAGLKAPYGAGVDGGPEASVGLLATMSIGTPRPGGGTPYAYVPRRIHLNATYIRNVDPAPGERDDRFAIGLGYSQPVTNDVVLVADLHRELERAEGTATNLVEIGARYVATPQTILSAGIGRAFGDDRTEDTRLTLGVQHALSYPWFR